LSDRLRIEVPVDAERLARYNEARGSVPMARFVRDALDEACRQQEATANPRRRSK
jgi:hypothetical protein